MKQNYLWDSYAYKHEFTSYRRRLINSKFESKNWDAKNLDIDNNKHGHEINNNIENDNEHDKHNVEIDNVVDDDDYSQVEIDNVVDDENDYHEEPVLFYVEISTSCLNIFLEGYYPTRKNNIIGKCTV
jgi:hypothetical protein